MNYDKILIKILYSNYNRIKLKLFHSILNNNYPNILFYLKNRYNDSSSILETINRIKYNIEIRPVCEYCGNPVNYICKNNYTRFCCASCASLGSRKKAEETNKRKFGVKYPIQSDEIKTKIKNTNFKKYGVYWNVENKNIKDKAIEASYNKYGVPYPVMSNKIKEKIKQTCINKYGVPYPFQNKEYMKEFVQKYHDKAFETMVKNNTIGKSKEEDDLFDFIKQLFPNVKRQYKDKQRYPYFCDFYIPELDYFIEYQGYWIHNNHPYDCNSINDNQLLEIWYKKYTINNKIQYLKAINGWTISDVNKRNCAKENNLNYKEIWNMNEGKEFIKNLYALHHQKE